MLHDLLQRTARVRSPPPGAACHLSRAPAACLRTLGLDGGGVVALQFIYSQRSYDIFPRRSSIILLISKFRGFCEGTPTNVKLNVTDINDTDIK